MPDEERPGRSQRSDGEIPPIADMIVDGVYTAIGLGVLAVNRVQVARRDAERRAQTDPKVTGGPSSPSDERWDRLVELMSDPETVRTVVGRLQLELQSMDDLVLEVERRLDQLLDRIEPDLPDPGRELVHLARSTGKDLSTHYRAVFGLRVP